MAAERLGADHALGVEDEGGGRGPLRHHAVLDHPAFISAAELRFLLAHGLRQHRGRFDVAPLPAHVRDGDDLHASLGVGIGDERAVLREGDDIGRGPVGMGEIPFGAPARDLEIDEAFV